MLNEKHNLIVDYLDVLLGTDINLLTIKSRAGIGKTHLISEYMRLKGLKEGIHYRYLSGHITPLAFFNLLSEAETLDEPKIVWLDDVDSVLTNKVSVALMKSALWGVNGKRNVSYETSKTDSTGGTRNFNCTSKVILVLNSVGQENALGASLLDRGIFYDMQITRKELCDYVENILDDIDSSLPPKTRKLIWSKIKKFSVNQTFSIRSVLKAMKFYKENPQNWWKMFVNSLKLTPEQKALSEIESLNINSKEKAKKYAQKMNKSTRSYHRIKAELTKNGEFYP